MGATLDALHRLQNIETQLRAVRNQIVSKRRSVETHQRRAASFERQIADTHDQIKHAQAEADRLELDRKTHEAHLAKLRETLNRTKTNKEYAAILTQLNTDKADTMKLEDGVLTAMSRVDELKKQEAEFRTNLATEQSRIRELEKIVADTEQRLSNQLNTLTTQRQAAAEQIPSEVLVLFERACDKHDGEAMAMIEQLHPKRAEYTCSGCNMSMTLETINSLQTRDIVMVCGTCSRILYLASHTHASA